MRINVTIQLDHASDLSMTADEAADLVMRALGGDKTRDHCVATIHMPSTSGTSGTDPNAPPPEVP